jgi:transcriptional regulatory protein LevR
VERHYRLDLTDEIGASLATHLAITMKRLMDGEELHGAPDAVWQELETRQEELALADTIVSELERKLALSIGADEVGFIAVHLCKIRQQAVGEES